MIFPRLPETDRNPPCWECGVDDVEDCNDPCGHFHCDHKAHCESCGQGFDFPLAGDGVCMLCEAQWLASHMLEDRKLVMGLDPGVEGGDRTVLYIRELDGSITAIECAKNRRESYLDQGHLHT